MLKGKTTIELKDVNTGEVEIIEEENMITDALQDIFTPRGIGAYRAQPFLADDKANVDNKMDFTGDPGFRVEPLMEGLYLFEDALDETASNSSLLDVTSNITGVGCVDFTSLSSNPLPGIYNAAASEFTPKKAKYVYEFNETQANGKISCVSLVPRLAAKYFPIDNPSKRPFLTVASQYKDAIYDYVLDHNLQPFTYYTNSDYPLYLDGTYLCCIDNVNINSSTYSTQTTIKVNKYNFNVTNLSSVYLRPKVDNLSSSRIVSTEEYTIPQEFLDYMNTISSANKGSAFYVYFDNDFIYYTLHIWPEESNNRYVKAGDTLKILKIDINTKNSTILSWTNNTGENLSMFTEQLARSSASATSLLSSPIFYIINDTIYMYRNFKILKANLKNSTDYSYIDFSNYGLTSYYYHRPTRYGDTLVMRGAAGSAQMMDIIYNTNTGKLRLTQPSCCRPGSYSYDNAKYTLLNGQGYGASYSLGLTNSFKAFVGKNMSFCINNYEISTGTSTSTCNRDNFTVRYNFYRLITINNLSKSITKTSNQTMTVTYTITQED